MNAVFDRTKQYQNLAEAHSVYFEVLERGREIVLKYIIEHKRILYGGMAIDLALKGAGFPGIYTEDTLPDYDFMSPDFYEDSNKLALLLQAAELPQVSSINALHVTSRKVRVSFQPVADITYIPPSIYEAIPYLELKKPAGLRVVHPDFQRLDLHRAFNYPYENPPMEVIFHRFHKDAKRLKLIREHFPLVREAAKRAGGASGAGGAGGAGFVVPLELLRGNMVGGMAALAYYEKRGAALDQEGLHLDADIKRATLYTDDFRALLAAIAKHYGKRAEAPRYYNKYLDDLRPRKINVAIDGGAFKYEVLDNYGKLFMACKLELQSEHAAKQRGAASESWICTVYGLPLYFLQRAQEKPKSREFYLGCYERALKLTDDPANGMSAETYGSKNWNSDYVYLMQEKINQFLRRGEALPASGARPVFGFYPANGTEYPPFKPEDSPLFAIDGRETKEFAPLTITLPS